MKKIYDEYIYLIKCYEEKNVNELKNKMRKSIKFVDEDIKKDIENVLTILDEMNEMECENLLKSI